MAPVAVLGVGELAAPLGHEAAEARDADVAGGVPDAHREIGSGEPDEQLTALRVVDRGRIDRAAGARLAGEPPERGGVALHHLAEPVADRLQPVVARSEPVGAGLEAAAACGQRERVVRADQLVRHPDRSAADEIAALDPEDRQARLEPVAVAGQPVRVGDPVIDAHLPVARELQRFRDVLGVPELGGFHHPRRLGRRDGEPLALRDGDRPGVGPNDHHHRDADAVEAGDVRDAGDTHGGEQRPQALECLLWGAHAVGAPRVALGRGPGGGPAVGRHGRAASNARASWRSGVSGPCRIPA